MFGDTPSGILILDFLLFVFGIVTIPLLYRIFTSLSKLLQNADAFTGKIAELCETNKEIKTELVNIQLRDKDFEHNLKNMNDKIETCQTDINNKIEELNRKVS